MSCRTFLARETVLLAACLCGMNASAVAEVSASAASSAVADHGAAIRSRIVGIAGDEQAAEPASAFVAALDGKIRAGSGQLGQVVHPSNPSRGQLTISSLVPPSSKSRSTNIPVCVEQGDRVLGTFFITPAGEVIGNAADQQQSAAASDGLVCTPWLRARAKAILISP